MSPLFRRRAAAEAAEPEPLEPDGAPGGVADATGPGAGDRGPRSAGPWDAAEPAPERPRIDLGGMRVPGIDGMELRVDVAEDRVVAATVVLGQAALQLQPFAAPRTTGIWTEVRGEIAAGITAQGGTATEQDGPFGTELRAMVPVQLPDGRPGHQPARFVGVDGPRWFLRGVFTGAAADHPDAAAPLEDAFRDTVVVRGGAPMPPREPLELRLPATPPDAVSAADGAVEESGPDAGPDSGVPPQR